MKKWWLVILFFLGVNIVLYWPFYFRGLLPFPGDLLVSFFFPWNTGGFAGYYPWTTHKEYIASDALRAIFPWKALAFDQINSGQIPLWNPYNFSGTPLLANFQSGVFSPANILYLFLPLLWAWVVNVLLLLSVFGFFTYLFLRTQRLSMVASLFGGLAASQITYLVNWHEILVISQTVLFLPLCLAVVNQYWQKRFSFWIFFTILSSLLAFGIFGGHTQTALIICLIVGLFCLWRKIPWYQLTGIFLFSLVLSSVQLLPSLELYRYSARESDATVKLFTQHLFPWQNFVTSLAPDFFGNPVTGNFWGWDYHNSLAYIGVVALFFAILAVAVRDVTGDQKFFLLLVGLGLFLATWPGGLIFLKLKIPVFSTGITARLIFLFQFGLCILSAYGLDWWLKKKSIKDKKVIYSTLVLIVGYLVLWFVTILGADKVFEVSRRNLLFPGVVFLTLTVFLVAGVIFLQFRRLVVLGVILLAVLEYGRFFNKISPFAPKEFAFPSHPLISFLQNKGGIDRFFGVESAFIERNFATYYKIFDPNGYDPLHIRRYGELLSSADNGGKIPITIQRSDAILGTENNLFRRRLLDILGVRYLLHVKEDYQSEWEEDPGRFDPDSHQLVWQEKKWKVFEKATVLPRAFLAGKYNVINNDQEILNKLYDPDFAFQEEVILEIDPDYNLDPNAFGKVTVEKYTPNEVVLRTTSLGRKILFLSDAYYPGWKATVDGREVPIYRANYAFRAVAVDKGVHWVRFRYQPLSYSLGMLTSIFGFSMVGVVLWRKVSWSKFGR